MNGAEQRRHTTKTATLASDLETIEAMLHETARRVKQQGVDLASVNCALDFEASERIAVGRSFWSRLNWLLRGR